LHALRKIIILREMPALPTQLTITLPNELLAKIDAYASKNNLTREQAIRQLIGLIL